MPTAILSFKLPEESYEHRVACHAGDLASALSDIAQRIRGRIKYEEPSEAEIETLESIRALIPFEFIE